MIGQPVSFDAVHASERLETSLQHYLSTHPVSYTYKENRSSRAHLLLNERSAIGNRFAALRFLPYLANDIGAFCRFLQIKTSVAPFLASPDAAALPIPEVAPVTMQTFPLISIRLDIGPIVAPSIRHVRETKN